MNKGLITVSYSRDRKGLKPTKNRKIRTIPISEACSSALNILRSKKRDNLEFIVLNEAGKPIGPEHFLQRRFQNNLCGEFCHEWWRDLCLIKIART